MNWMEFLTTPSNLLAIGVAIAAFATIVTLFSSSLGGAQLNTRMKAVADRREELRRRSRAAMQQPQAVQQSTIRQTDVGFKKRIVDRLNLTKALEDPKVADLMAQAGFRGPGPITTFYFFRLAMPFVLGILFGLYLFGLNDFGMPVMNRICIVVGGVVLGYYAPNIYLKNKADKRRQSIMQAFPDALDLLLICVEAGMSIEQAISKVGGEVGSQSIDLAEEFGLLSAELSYLPERRMAYENLARRTNHPGVKSVVTAMVQAEKYGTPLAQALRVMAKENRDLRIAAAEKKAAALPAQLTVPMILFFLPVLFVVILGPAIIKIQDMQSENAEGARAASMGP